MEVFELHLPIGLLSLMKKEKKTYEPVSKACSLVNRTEGELKALSITEEKTYTTKLESHPQNAVLALKQP